MVKKRLSKNVYDAAVERIDYSLKHFEKCYLSFSGGKDSTVMLHIVMDRAKKLNKKIGVLFIDLEGQYKYTIEHIEECYKQYKSNIEPFWVALPLHLRNAVSVFEPFWLCWDRKKQNDWIRLKPKESIGDESYFPFFKTGMEFEEFVPEFGKWYAKGKSCCCFVGIRADESLNRFRTIASNTKKKFKNKQWTTQVIDKVYNSYPIYDWTTEDVWIYHNKNPKKRYNKLYDLMHKAGLTINQQRICQPYGDDQRRGLWLFHLIEPATWAKVVARVSGANSGALYIQENGNINGYHKVKKPKGHTWKSFVKLLIQTMPKVTQEHYENKIILFERWWLERGYPEGIPDEAAYELEAKKLVPSWRRICKSILRNDYWCKGLSFSQHKSTAYKKYLELMKRRKQQWNESLINY